MDWHPIRSVFPPRTRCSEDRLRIYRDSEQDYASDFYFCFYFLRVVILYWGHSSNPDSWCLYFYTHIRVCVSEIFFAYMCTHTHARTCVRKLFKPIRSQQCDENETQVELEVLLIFEMVGWGCLMCIPHTHTLLMPSIGAEPAAVLNLVTVWHRRKW